MLHGIDYPDENPTKKEDGTPSQNLDVRYYNCAMKDGIIIFPPPNDASVKRRTVFEDQPIKEFVAVRNLLPVDAEGGDT
ncbi:hypothetical protein SDC9_109555 [bioreactor metagenome]|uniref:Uncharacterized protein n=1 Tax=bioreactor metagenome TaxID=1076179 RepID=A0A645BC95_9ZZZZ